MRFDFGVGLGWRYIVLWVEDKNALKLIVACLVRCFLVWDIDFFVMYIFNFLIFIFLIFKFLNFEILLIDVGFFNF